VGGFGRISKRLTVVLHEDERSIIEKYSRADPENLNVQSGPEFDYIDRAQTQTPGARALRSEERRQPTTWATQPLQYGKVRISSKGRARRQGFYRVSR